MLDICAGTVELRGWHTLLLVAFINASLVIELGTNLLQQLVEATALRQAAMRIHRHSGRRIATNQLFVVTAPLCRMKLR